MQATTIITFSPYTIELDTSKGKPQARVQGAGLQMNFKGAQIKCGVMGDLKYQTLLDKINQIGVEKFSAFPFPKENPTELWLVEAVRMAGLSIRTGREYLHKDTQGEKLGFNHPYCKILQDENLEKARLRSEAEREKGKLLKECYKRALHHFKIALNIQTKAGGDIADLKCATDSIQKKKDFLKWKLVAPRYLPNLKEIEHFEELLETYEGEEDDIYSCFESIFTSQTRPQPYHYWIWSLFHEKNDNWEQAIEAYLNCLVNNPLVVNCLSKAYALLSRSPPQLVGDRRDAIQKTFEKYLEALHANSSYSSPKCFICYDIEDEAIEKWLRESLVPDLQRVGLTPIAYFQDLNIGANRNDFHELPRMVPLVIVIFTPKLKAMYEEESQTFKGVMQEIQIVKQRFGDKEKKEATFPIALNGLREQALPKGYFESIECVELSTKPFDFKYFINAFRLFASIRKLELTKAKNLCEQFIEEIKPILRGNINRNELTNWRENKKRIAQILKNTATSNMTKINWAGLPTSFTGCETELSQLHKHCCQKGRVIITGSEAIGKTSLALRYADIYQDVYSLIYFTPAKTPHLINEGLLKLANELLEPRLGETDEEKLNRLKKLLGQAKQNYLLIYDGISVKTIQRFDEIAHYFPVPQRGSCLLLTSCLPENYKIKGYKKININSRVIKELND